MSKYTISQIKVSVVKTQSAGADYTDHAEGHWINDRVIANPMSVYKDYQHSRSSWGMDVLKGIFIQIYTEGGHEGFATAYGGYLSTWIIKKHLERFFMMFSYPYFMILVCCGKPIVYLLLTNIF